MRSTDPYRLTGDGTRGTPVPAVSRGAGARAPLRAPVMVSAVGTTKASGGTARTRAPLARGAVTAPPGGALVARQSRGRR